MAEPFLLKNPLSDSKANLRNQIKEKLSSLSLTQKVEFSQKANANLLEFLTSRRLQNIFISYSLSDEIDTQGFISENIKKLNFFLPKINTVTNLIGAHPVKDVTKELAIGTFNISEPITAEELNFSEKIDCIVVPARAIDIEGNRLGRGKGYYDKFLANANIHNKIVVCMLYHCQLVAEVRTETHDIPIEYCITEKGVFHLRRKSK